MRLNGHASTRVSPLVRLGCRWQTHRGTLYIVSVDEIFASDNRGETWRTLGPRPKGDAVELVITDAERTSSSQVPFTMYLALRDEGIFRSTDSGAHWHPLNDGLTTEKISAMATVGKNGVCGYGERPLPSRFRGLEKIANRYIRSRLFLGSLWE